MTFLPVAVRELAVAARRPGTYAIRAWSALLVFVIMAIVLVERSSSVSLAEQGRTLFSVLSTLAFYYALFAGARVTADCVSSEKRDGTLGLLFLTDLKGYDVVAGKLVASSLNSVYWLMAIVPMLAFSLVFGGVTGAQVLRTVLLLGNTLFFSLAVGIFVSTLSRNERHAMFAAILCIIAITFGPYAVANYYTYGVDQSAMVAFDKAFLVPSPLHAYQLAGSRTLGATMGQGFYTSLLVVHWVSWSLLILASVILPRVCHDRPKGSALRRWGERLRIWSCGDRAIRDAFRRRLLDRNAYFWLAGRDRFKVSYVWLFLGVLAGLWYWGYLRFKDLMFDWVTSAWIVLFVHAFFKIWVASEVCARLVEDRRSGALELLLSTPLAVKHIVRGQSLALWRQFGMPVLVVLALDWWLLQSALRSFSWNAGRIGITILFLAGMVMLVLDLITLKAVGMWAALSARNANRAILASIFRVLVVPWIAYAVVHFLSVSWFQRVFAVGMGWPVPGFPIVSWYGWPLGLLACSWFAIGLVNNLLFGFLARRRLFRQFRIVAAERLIFGSGTSSAASSSV